MVGKKLAKKSNKQLTSIESMKAELRKETAQKQAQELLGGGDFIRALKGKFLIGEEELGEEITAIILGFAHEKTYYKAPYDPSDFVLPDCYAVSMHEKDLLPHEKVLEPQSDTCGSCDLKNWHDEEKPECSARRRLLLIEHDCDRQNPTIYKMSVSPSGLKAWRQYPNFVEKETGLQLRGVITTISWNYEDKTIHGDPKLKFDLVSEIDDPALFALSVELYAKHKSELLEPIQAIGSGDLVNKKAEGKKVGGKKVGGKKVKSEKPKNKRRY